MGSKDLTEKILEDYNDVFADIVNVLLFQGERRVNPDTLSNAGVHSQYKDSEGKLHEEERDVAKFWNPCNVKIALYGIENQTRIEKRMPFRIFGYEGASYREQLKQKTVYPVVTIVLYFGTEQRWTAPKTLKELVNIPDGLDSYVNDLKINVFEVAWLPDDVIAKFTSDFKIVANFFSKKRKNSNYIPDDKTEIVHVNEVLKLLSAMTNDNRYEELMVQGKEKVHTMCDVAERLENKGRTEGRSEGRAEEQIKTILKLYHKGNTVEEIVEFYENDFSVEDIQKIIKNCLKGQE